MKKTNFLEFIGKCVNWFSLDHSTRLANFVQIFAFIGIAISVFSYFDTIKQQNEQTRIQIRSNILGISYSFHKEIQTILDSIQHQAATLNLNTLSCEILNGLADSGKIQNSAKIEDCYSLSVSICELLNLLENIAIYYSLSINDEEKQLVLMMFGKDIRRQVNDYKCFLEKEVEKSKHYVLLDSIVKQWEKKEM
jgi:hypothetical protein